MGSCEEKEVKARALLELYSYVENSVDNGTFFFKFAMLHKMYEDSVRVPDLHKKKPPATPKVQYSHTVFMFQSVIRVHLINHQYCLYFKSTHFHVTLFKFYIKSLICCISPADSLYSLDSFLLSYKVCIIIVKSLLSY